MALLTYFFLGWVGLGLVSSVGFIMVLTCFATQQNLVLLRCKHPTRTEKKKKEMLPTIQQRTQVDGSHEYPAVVVLVPFNSDSLYTLF